LPRRVLYLIRHGHFDDTTRPADGLGGNLTVTGLEQARLTAHRLRDLPIGVIHHSPLTRAVETAVQLGAIWPGVPLRSSPLLAECIPGFPAAMADLFAHVTAERVARDGRQAERAFTRYFQPARRAERHELIVCHGNIIRYFVCRALQAPAEHWVYARTHHCGISQIEIEANGLAIVVSYNDTGHLPHALRTYL
jgi:serine/threonine-protein phosphatase PGAM5